MHPTPNAFVREDETHPPLRRSEDIIDLTTNTPPTTPDFGRVDMTASSTSEPLLIDLSKNDTPTFTSAKRSSSSSSTSSPNKKMNSDWENRSPFSPLSPNKPYGSSTTLYGSSTTSIHSRSVSTSSNATSRGHTLAVSANVVDSMVEDCRKPASYTPPSRETIEDLCRRAVHQPVIPSLATLIGSVEWQREIDNLMSVEGMAAAGVGLARMDKGKSDKNELRILRTIVRDPITGKLIDKVLQERAPKLYELLKILMEEHDLQDVACQKMGGQEFHGDPHAHDAKPENEGKDCHVLITIQEEHSLAVSSSSLIQALDERFKIWKGGRASVKVGDEQLDDIYIMPRQGERPFMAVHQWLLGGNTTGASSSSEEPVTPGIPKDTSQDLIQIKRDRAQEFQKPGGPGILMSTSILGNFLGTPEAAAEAVATASTRVLQMFTLTKVTLPIATRIHKRDLAEFQDMYDAGKISNLSFKSQGFWSDGRKLAHKERCVGDGSCLGAMPDGSAKDAHLEKCVKGGGSERGHMAEGTAKDEFVAKCVAKGAIEAGRMVGTKRDEHTKKCMKGDADIHFAKVAAGHEKKNALLLQLANGKLKQGNEWRNPAARRELLLNTFSNGNDDPIEGKRAFVEHLLKSYTLEELTEEGKSAYVVMKKKHEEMNKRNARNAQKKQRAN